MRSKKIILLIFTLTLILSFGCKKLVTPEREKVIFEDEKVSINIDNVLDIIPIQTQGIIFLNAQKIANTKLFDKLITIKLEKTKNYYKFIKKLGIDPKKDIYSLAFANSY